MTITYIGDGQHISGIPARDLTDVEVQRLADEHHMLLPDFVDMLTQRGLYTVEETITPDEDES
jgi:hypothetical protein